MNPVILPSNDSYVNIFPKLPNAEPLITKRHASKSILSGKTFEPAEPMTNKNELYNSSGYFGAAKHGRN